MTGRTTGAGPFFPARRAARCGRRSTRTACARAAGAGTAGRAALPSIGVSADRRGGFPEAAGARCSRSRSGPRVLVVGGLGPFGVGVPAAGERGERPGVVVGGDGGVGRPAGGDPHEEQRAGRERLVDVRRDVPGQLVEGGELLLVGVELEPELLPDSGEPGQFAIVSHGWRLPRTLPGNRWPWVNRRPRRSMSSYRRATDPSSWRRRWPGSPPKPTCRSASSCRTSPRAPPPTPRPPRSR